VYPSIRQSVCLSHQQAHETRRLHGYRYCGIHDASMVAQCEVTGKWFCNGTVNPGGACIVQHLVRGHYKEVRLHPESALGSIVLECYHSGSRNVFSLGFVPVKADDTMVLLSRDTPSSAPCIKELDLDLNLWEPLIQVCPTRCRTFRWHSRQAGLICAATFWFLLLPSHLCTEAMACKAQQMSGSRRSRTMSSCICVWATCHWETCPYRRLKNL
jgi:hypothetical protein